MKRDTTIISLLLPLCLALAAADCGGDARADVTPPKPKATAVTGRFVIAPDSSVTATATASITGQLYPGDSIRFRFFKDDTLKVARTVAALSVTANLPAPVYCATGAYKVAAQVKRQATFVGDVKWSALWSYPRECPLPVLDGVQITPASVTVAPGQTVQFVASAS